MSKSSKRNAARKFGSAIVGASLVRTDSVAPVPKAPACSAGALRGPQSPRRPLERDQISEKLSSSSSKRLA